MLWHRGDCIGELAGKRLLNMDEKAAVCRKIRSSMYKPSFAVTIAVKIMPFLAVLTVLVGMKYILEGAPSAANIGFSTLP